MHVEKRLQPIPDECRNKLPESVSARPLKTLVNIQSASGITAESINGAGVRLAPRIACRGEAQVRQELHAV